MKNRFNRLSSKEWLPFQKSWFKCESEEKLIRDNLLFFAKSEITPEKILYLGSSPDFVKQIGEVHNLTVVDASEYEDEPLQFAILDLREKVSALNSTDDYLMLQKNIATLAERIYKNLEHRRFIAIFMPNTVINGRYIPVAWDLALQLSGLFSLKDEKIACLSHQKIESELSYSMLDEQYDTFYCLYFRKDENSGGEYNHISTGLINNSGHLQSSIKFSKPLPSWFILKPAPRKKNEVLHPAKYPEELVTMFLQTFTSEGDNVFDPMSGTGSTQVAAIKLGRNGYGTELSDFFFEIAKSRCQDLVNPVQKELFAAAQASVKFLLLNKDARKIKKDDFPMINYIITSPPYWDMLNMKGAENQAKRIDKGLQTNYSDSGEDLGNLADYQKFIDELVDIYFNIFSLMEPGSFATMVVKNIKKKGRNYPFAWHLASRLMEKAELLPEVFWCQDDINLAPYGYGNTFVSNTFHQYCLNFRVL